MYGLPSWPGSESVILLAIANYLIQNDLYDKEVCRALGQLARNP